MIASVTIALHPPSFVVDPFARHAGRLPGMYRYSPASLQIPGFLIALCFRVLIVLMLRPS
ncbi:hypothetical protein [Burkholderia sp. F1]|uniref:hypothetical protein n=1 Tax=Burkholderia sp. F1 TaxID=3366817 RepID=UPI003D73E91F